MNSPDFQITSSDRISAAFLARNIYTFQQAAAFIQQLPYRRNSNKNDLLTVFTDNCGTCSTKHAVLKMLADENNFETFELVIGLFRMNAVNTSPVAETLHSNHLDYIPEAHCLSQIGSGDTGFHKAGFSSVQLY